MLLTSMQMPLIFGLILAACLALFFIAPLRQFRAESFKPRTLYGIYRDLFKDMPSLTDRRTCRFALLGAAGLFSAFYPAILPVMAGRIPPMGSGEARTLFITGGLIALVGAAINLLAILLSHMNFAFGGSSSSAMTLFSWALPAFHTAAALASIAIGAIAPCGRWAHDLLG